MAQRKRMMVRDGECLRLCKNMLSIIFSFVCGAIYKERPELVFRGVSTRFDGHDELLNLVASCRGCYFSTQVDDACLLRLAVCFWLLFTCSTYLLEQWRETRLRVHEVDE